MNRNLFSFILRVGLIIGTVVLGLTGSPSYAVNLLTNGSFESGTYSFGGDGGQNLVPGSTTITAWTIATNDVAPLLAGNIHDVTPQDGSISLDLQGYTDAAPYGGVEQIVPTIPGGLYQLRFWIGVHNSISFAVGPASVTATAGATSQNFTNTLAGPGNQWQQFSMDFTATNPATTISLSGLSTQGGAYIGLDNAELELLRVPEPSTFVLAMLAATICRRRSTTSKRIGPGQVGHPQR